MLVCIVRCAVEVELELETWHERVEMDHEYKYNNRNI